MAVSSIEPQTDATLNVTVMVDGVPQTNATVTVPRVYMPDGSVIVTNLTLTHTANGVYPLPIAKEWSTGPNGESITGWFVAEIKAVIASNKQRLKHRRYLVADE